MQSSLTGIGGPLGCGTYRVYAFDRGGQDRIGEITPLATVQWSRTRDDISSALISTTGFGQDCCELLSQLRAMRHELVIYRDGVRVWEGPITRIAYRYDSVEIEAKDVMQYLFRRVMRAGYNHKYPYFWDPKYKKGDKKHRWGSTVTRTAKSIIQDALVDWRPASDTTHDIYRGGLDPNVYQYLTVYQYDDDARESRYVFPFQKTVWEEIDDLASNAGMDYVTVGRRIIIWDTSRAIGRTEPLDDSAFMATPVVTEYGASMSTLSVVTDGQGYYGMAGTDDDYYYGRIEILASSFSSNGAPDKTGIPSAKAIGDAYSKYAAARDNYEKYPGLTHTEATNLARWERERGTPGVTPERQKWLDAHIKPLRDRDNKKKALKTTMNTYRNRWEAAKKANAKYADQVQAYKNNLTSQAIRNQKGRNPAPLTVRIPDNSQLNPAVDLGINDLIPGIWIPLRSRVTCREFAQWQKLDNVTVVYDDSGTEQVQVTMSPAPQNGADPDASDNTPVDD
jgi:hypothetical protein